MAILAGQRVFIIDQQDAFNDFWTLGLPGFKVLVVLLRI